MALNTALTAGDYTKLRGATGTVPTYVPEQYISLCPNTTVFACRVNQASFAESFAQVTYDGVTTGAYTDVQAGMTVLFSHTNDRRAAFHRTYARTTPTNLLLYIGETSAPVADNDYVFVLADYDLFERLARDVAGVRYIDYDAAFRQLPPVIYNIQSCYADWVSGSPEGYTVRFNPTAVAGTAGATISSYAFTAPTGVVTAGNPATNDVTYRFSYGFHRASLVVTDSGSRTTTLQINVWAHHPTSYPPELGFTGATITGADGGFSGTIGAFDGIDDVLDNTLCCIWSKEYYNGTQGAIDSNVELVGRLRKETNQAQADEEASTVLDLSWEIEGPAAQLARIEAPLVYMLNDAAPDAWDEIASLTIWRGIVYLLAEYSTYFRCFPLELTDTGTTFLYDAFSVRDPGQKLLDVINDLMNSINGRMEFNGQGEAWLTRDVRYIETADRGSYPTISDFIQADAIDVALEVDPSSEVGLITASGGCYDSTADTVEPFLADAPGAAPKQGERSAQLTKQILTANATSANAQLEIRRRVGHDLERRNHKEVLRVIHPDGYRFFAPSVGQRYTWTLPTSTNLRGRSYDTSTYWLLQNITVRHDNDAGTKEIEAEYTIETTGTPGRAVPVPIDESIIVPPVDLPESLYPVEYPVEIGTTDSLHLHQGVQTMLFVDTNGYQYVTTDFGTSSVSGGPTYTRTNLSVNGTPVQFVVNAFSPRYLGTGTELNYWLITSTRIYYVTDALGTPVVTSQHTFAAATTSRSADASFAEEGFVAVASYYGTGQGANRGVRVIVTTDGATWGTETTVTAFYCTETAYNGNVKPGCYVSSRTAGKIFISAFTATGNDGATASELFASLDYGANWAAGNGTTTPDINTGNLLASDLHVPWDDNAAEMTIYFGYLRGVNAPGGSEHFLYRSLAGAAATDITPTYGGENYAPAYYSRWVYFSAPLNRQRMVVVGLTTGGTLVFGVFTSPDGGANWTARALNTSYRRAALAGDNPNVIYLWGASGAVGYSQDFGATIDDRSGNLSTFATPAVGEFIGVAGG